MSKLPLNVVYSHATHLCESPLQLTSRPAEANAGKSRLMAAQRFHPWQQKIGVHDRPRYIRNPRNNGARYNEARLYVGVIQRKYFRPERDETLIPNPLSFIQMYIINSFLCPPSYSYLPTTPIGACCILK